MAKDVAARVLDAYDIGTHVSEHSSRKWPHYH